MGTVLLGALTLGPTPALANVAEVTDPPPVSSTPDPGDSQSPPPDESATPTPTSAPSDGAPPSPSPTPHGPSLSPTATRHRPHRPHPVLKVTVSASNALLDSGYWHGAGTTSFTLTVRNTGTVTAAARIDYTVPDGVSDVATGACAHGHCSVPSVAPDATLTLPVAITVSPDAWRRAPLSGRFTVTASAVGAKAAGAQGTWGIVFPPGPPASGINLEVGDVNLDDRPDAPGRLWIRLTNTGALPAAARLDVVLPSGVDAGPMPRDCADQPRPDPATARCLPGSLAPGEQRSIVVPLTVDAAARAGTPLTGLVRATLTAAGQEARVAQASYQVLVPASLSGVTAGAPASVVPSIPPRLGGGVALDSRDALAWPLIGGGGAALIGAIVGLLLKRRGRSVAKPTGKPAGAPVPAPAPAGRHEWRTGGARRSGTGPAPVPAASGEARPDRAGPGVPAVRRPAAENPVGSAGNPPEVVAELTEVAAELAEVAAILGGGGASRDDRPA